MNGLNALIWLMQVVGGLVFVHRLSRWADSPRVRQTLHNFGYRLGERIGDRRVK